MSEKPRFNRYKNLEYYSPTIPGSAQAWNKAASMLTVVLLQASDEQPLPESITVLYADEPKVIHLDFMNGKALEMDVYVAEKDGRIESKYEPTGEILQFSPAIDPNDRLQRVEDVKKSIEDMLETNPPPITARTN